MSPIHVRAKLLARRISCNELDALKRALGGQHPIERITVGDSVAACLGRVAGVDRHQREAVGRYQFGEPIADVCGLIEFAETKIYGNRLYGRRTDKNGVRLVSNGRPGRTRQRLIIGHRTQKSLRVERSLTRQPPRQPIPRRGVAQRTLRSRARGGGRVDAAPCPQPKAPVGRTASRPWRR